MPGLLRGVARTAVIAGTATHVSNNVSRRQQQRWASQQQPEEAAQPVDATPVAPTDTNDQIAQLEKLGELQKAGILTPEEFAAKKQQILGL